MPRRVRQAKVAISKSKVTSKTSTNSVTKNCYSELKRKLDLDVSKEKLPSATVAKQLKTSQPKGVVKRLNFQDGNNNATVVKGKELAELNTHDGILVAVDPGDELDYDDVFIHDESADEQFSDVCVNELDNSSQTDNSSRDGQSPKQNISNKFSVEQLLANPQLQVLLDQLVEQKLKKDRAIATGESSQSTVLTNVEQIKIID